MELLLSTGLMAGGADCRGPLQMWMLGSDGVAWTLAFGTSECLHPEHEGQVCLHLGSVTVRNHSDSLDNLANKQSAQDSNVTPAYFYPCLR